MGIIYDYCGGCGEICGSPRCFNCKYFNGSYLMYEPGGEDYEDEDYEEEDDEE